MEKNRVGCSSGSSRRTGEERALAVLHKVGRNHLPEGASPADGTASPGPWSGSVLVWLREQLEGWSSWSWVGAAESHRNEGREQQTREQGLWVLLPVGWEEMGVVAQDNWRGWTWVLHVTSLVAALGTDWKAQSWWPVRGSWARGISGLMDGQWGLWEVYIFWMQSRQDTLIDYTGNVRERGEERRLQIFWPKQVEGWNLDPLKWRCLWKLWLG